MTHPPTAIRHHLPVEREGLTHKFVIRAKEKHKGYVTVGLYPDGRPGEVFIKMDRQGSDVSGFIDAWAISVSMLLQTGTSLRIIVDKFKNMRFEPAGLTETDGIRFAASPVSYICCWLEKTYLKENDDDESTEAASDAGPGGDRPEAPSAEGSDPGSGKNGEGAE